MEHMSMLQAVLGNGFLIVTDVLWACMTILWFMSGQVLTYIKVKHTGNLNF